MNIRRAILVFMYSERIKSELLIASNLLAKMFTLENEERNGAEKMMTSYLETLTGEIRIAQNIEKSINFIGAERKIMEAIGKMKLSQYEDINRCISEALSFITTSSQASMEALEKEGLV